MWHPSFQIFWTHGKVGYPKINVAVNKELDLSENIADLFYKTSYFDFNGSDYDTLVGGVNYLVDKIIFNRLKF